MIMCQVGEYPSCKGQSGNTSLFNGMGTHLHEDILAPLINHVSKQGVELNRVRGGVCGILTPVMHKIAHRREQSALVPHRLKHIIKQGGDSCLAICTGDTCQLYLPGCLLYTSDAADDLTRVDLGG